MTADQASRSRAALSPEAVDYLLRLGADPLARTAGSVTSTPPAARRTLRVHGRGVRSKTNSPERETRSGVEVVSALSTAAVPFAVQVSAEPSGTAFNFGVWSLDPVLLPQCATVLSSALRGAYLGATLEETEPPKGQGVVACWTRDRRATTHSGR